MTVEIYTKAFCPYCWRAKQLLEDRGVEYQEIPVDYGGEARDIMMGTFREDERSRREVLALMGY